ncbi:hypothetical protein NW754_010373 [Fusarium falciforme]|nr:hypothetical protein NW754_010373 [Fusarium falciforme]
MNELVIGDTYAAEEDYISAEKQYLFAKKKSDKLSEPIMERAVCISLFRVYMAQRRFDDAWPLTFKVLATFTLVAVLRVNKVFVTLAVMSSGFYIAIGVSGAIVLVARWL